MEDDAFGIVYLIETPQGFWSELEEILSLPVDSSLEYLDSRLATFVRVCAAYHERYLSTPAQLDHSCQLLLDSDFFAFHSDRSCERLLQEAKVQTDPHVLFVLYSIFLARGRRHYPFFRAQTLWDPIFPLLMDHVIFEALGDTSSDYIESKLRYLAVEMLFELCRLQKLTASQLGVFTDAFIDDLFDLVENSRSNEMLSYSVIRFLVCLNEQFMVASVRSSRQGSPAKNRAETAASGNRVLKVLMRRLNDSKSFGENLIFMLNRADDTPEDQALQLLILKMLYLLFTTPGTQEYFYTNDLRVLVDVFVRELNNLADENESLIHTYLRALYPLLNNTQLKDNLYKPLLVQLTLQNFVSHGHIRDIDPTTRRLVDRCLSGDWCRHLTPPPNAMSDSSDHAEAVSPMSDTQVIVPTMPTNLPSNGAGLTRQRSLKKSASAEMLRRMAPCHETEARNGKDNNNPNFAGLTNTRSKPFSSLNRQVSVKMKRGQGITAHMASLSIVGHNDSSMGSVAGTTGGGQPRPLTPRSETGFISPTPTSPQAPPSPPPPPPSDAQAGSGGNSPVLLLHPKPHLRHHHHLIQPVRSRSADPMSPTIPELSLPLSPAPTVSTTSTSTLKTFEKPCGSATPVTSSSPAISASGSSMRAISAPASFLTVTSRRKSKSPPPPPPPRRRKPPAPPIPASASAPARTSTKTTISITPASRGETIHTIASSSSSSSSSSPPPPPPPLSSSSRPSPLNPDTLASLRAKKHRNNIPPPR